MKFLLQKHWMTQKLLQTIYNSLPMDLDVIPLKEQYPSIFQWMALLDYNIIIILVVMTIVGVINMATALLIMIFERSRMIGLLKTLGSSNLLIHRIFSPTVGLFCFEDCFGGMLLDCSFIWTALWAMDHIRPNHLFC